MKPRSSTPRGRLLAGLTLVLALALGLRTVAAVQYQRAHPQAEHLSIDEESYDSWARELAAGDWLGDAVFFQEPLYPYALGAFYRWVSPERVHVRFAQALLGALACVLTVLVGRRAFGATAGWIGGLALALHPPAILLPSLLLKPNLVLLVLLGLVLALPPGEGRARRWFGVGVLAGLGALLRGNVLVLLPVLVAWPLLRAALARAPLRPALPRAAAVLGGVALVLAPVALRNWAVGGVVALSTSGAGTNLYGGNNELNPYGVATEFPWVRGIPRHEAEDWRAEAERRTGRALDAAGTSAFWSGEVRRSARERPALHARILWNKLRATLGAYEVPDNHLLEWDRRYVPLLRRPWPGFGLWGTLGLAGLFAFLARGFRRDGYRHGGARPRAAIELAALVCLYLATIVLTVTSDRVRLALVPLLLPFAGAFVAASFERLRSRAAPRAWIGPASALLVAALVVHVPVFDASTRAGDLADREHNHAVALLEQGRLEEATALAQDLARDWPGSARIQLLLADCEWRRGWALAAEPETRAQGQERIGAVLARLRALLELPGLAPKEASRARRLAGWIQLALGNAGAAERHFRLAREFAPRDADLALGHAQALIALVEGGAREHGAQAGELLDGLAARAGYAPAVDELRARLARALE